MDRTSIEAVPQAHPLDADDPQIFRYPFLYLASEAGHCLPSPSGRSPPCAVT